MEVQFAFQAFNLLSHANYGNNFGADISVPGTFGNPIVFINPTSTTLGAGVHGQVRR